MLACESKLGAGTCTVVRCLGILGMGWERVMAASFVDLHVGFTLKPPLFTYNNINK